MMTNNGNDVNALTAQAATPAVTLTLPFPCREAALPSSSSFLVVYIVVVLVVMFKSLHLVETERLNS